jgi:acyl-coenzyme A synthetase/AMP-(fatty) acid ligase
VLGRVLHEIVAYNQYAVERQGTLAASGPALPYYKVGILEKFGKLLPSGWTGDIRIEGPGVSRDGFIGPSEDNHEFHVDSETYARSVQTGDKGYMDDYGHLYVVSRL